MKLFSGLLFLGLFLFSSSALAAPVKEEDFLKAEEARFAAADANKNGRIDSSAEAKAAFLSSALNMSEPTRELCIKARIGIVPQYTGPNPPKTKDGKFAALAKNEFMAARKALFGMMDQNKDKTVVDAEAKVFDQRISQQCGASLGQGSPQEKGRDGGKAHYQLD
jgi:hypothetical protein